MRILAVAAHPDDIEFAMGGTMIKLAAEGHEVFGLVLTGGEMGTHGTGGERKNEAANAAKTAGYKLEMLDFPDTEIVDSVENRKVVANIVRKIRPAIVFAPYHTNVASHRNPAAHHDHTTTGHLVRNALRIAKFQKVKLNHEPHLVEHIVYYMVPRSVQPTFIADITPYKDRLVEVMHCHKSQADDFLIERLLTLRTSSGMMIGAQYGEAFVVEDPLKFDVSILKQE